MMVDRNVTDNRKKNRKNKRSSEISVVHYYHQHCTSDKIRDVNIISLGIDLITDTILIKIYYYDGIWKLVRYVYLTKIHFGSL